MADDNFVSMLDLEQDTQELMGFNPEADANAMLPPIPAMRASVVVRFTAEEPEKRWQVGVWGKDEQKTYFASVTATLYGAGEFDGRTVRANVSTYVSRETCSVQGLLQALGMQDRLRVSKSRSALVTLLNEALAGDGAACECELDWEANEQTTEEQREVLKKEGKKPYRLQGMKRFPVDPTDNTKFIPVINYQGVDLRAYNVVKRWITVSDASAGAKHVDTPIMGAPKPVSATAPRPAANAAPHAAQTHHQPASAPSAPVQAGPPIPAGARRAQQQPQPAQVGGAVPTGAKR